MALFPTGPLVRAPRPLAPRRYGLFSVTDPINPGVDTHWTVGGVNWEDTLCTTVESFVDLCPPATGFTKPAERDMNFCHSGPFQVVGSFDCSVGGRVRQYNAGEAFEIARQRLLQWEEHEVEEVLWTGQIANSPLGIIDTSLANGNSQCGIDPIDLTPVGGAVNPVDAISILEGALADTIPGGAIHISHELVAYLANFMLWVTEGDRAYTPLGNSYIAGAGYPTSGPANVAAGTGEAWIFATGPVAVWGSDIYMVPDELSQAVNRSINDVTVRAERYYAVGYSCAVYAVLVDLTCACA